MRLRNYLMILIAATVACAGLLFVSFFVTSPTKLGPYGVTLWFVLLFGAIAGAASLGIYLVKNLVRPAEQPTKRLLESLRQAVLISGWLTVVLALSSLKQLNPRDILLSLIMIILIEIYFNLR